MNFRPGLLIVVFLAIAPNFAAAQSNSNIASQVLTVEKKWNEVYKQGDIATMNSLLAPDFIITVENGSTFSKPGFLARSGNSTVHVIQSDMSDLQVRIHGDTAVVTGAYHEKGTDNGKSYEYRDRLTDVWMNHNDSWRLIASHYSLAGCQ